MAIITAKGKDAMPYIQDFTKAMCQTQASSSAITVQDRRDGQNYTVRYINGNCWMTRNLAIGCNGVGGTYGPDYSQITLTKTLSNVSSDFITPTTGMSSCDSYTDACQTCSAEYGAYYNYVAATAGTITGSTNSNIPEYSICPTGWKIPTSSEFNTVINYLSTFNPVYAGFYDHTKLRSNTVSAYWGTTPDPRTDYGTPYYSWREVFYGNVDGATFLSSVIRADGLTLRCIRSS